MPAQTFKLAILAPAQRELEEIARVYLELAGADSARRITDLILNSLERLKTYPLSGSLPRDRWLREAGYRLGISGKFIVAYRLLGDTVFVYHIAHGASDYPTLMKNY
jgi:plasmid stabilization system protein ParE